MNIDTNKNWIVDIKNQPALRQKTKYEFSACVCVAQIALHFQGLGLVILMSWHSEMLERCCIRSSLSISGESEQSGTILHTDCSYSDWL